MEDESNTRRLLINSALGISSTIIATLLIGLYVKIDSTSQEIIRLQEQVRSLQGNVNESRSVVSDVKALHTQFDLVNQRIHRLEEGKNR